MFQIDAQPYEIPGRLILYYRAFALGTCSLTGYQAFTETPDVKSRKALDIAMSTNLAYAIGGLDPDFMSFCKDAIAELGSMRERGYIKALRAVHSLIKDHDIAGSYIEDIAIKFFCESSYYRNDYESSGDWMTGGIVPNPEIVPSLIDAGIDIGVSPFGRQGQPEASTRMIAAESMQSAIESFPSWMFGTPSRVWVSALRLCCFPQIWAERTMLETLASAIEEASTEWSGLLAGEGGVVEVAYAARNATEIIRSGSYNPLYRPEEQLLSIRLFLEEQSRAFDSEDLYYISQRVDAAASLSTGWIPSEDVANAAEWNAEVADEFGIKQWTYQDVEPGQSAIESLGAKLIR